MPDLPPLFDGRAVTDEPLEIAIAAAVEGCDAGFLPWRADEVELSAALVLAPDVSLADAAAMFLVAGNGFADALGALAPAEIAVHLQWPGGFRIEGGHCGGLRLAAPSCRVEDVPGWLVVGLRVAVGGDSDVEPGERPDQTDLRAEGIWIGSEELLGAWARHTLSWITRWEDEGMGPVHRDWTARAWDVGRPASVETPAGTHEGIAQGLDERGGILLKGEHGTELVPLTQVIDRR